MSKDDIYSSDQEHTNPKPDHSVSDAFNEENPNNNNDEKAPLRQGDYYGANAVIYGFPKNK